MNGNTHRSVLLVRIVLGLIPLAAGLYVIGIGQDANWDLRNYHFYNPFAYLTGRMGHDVAVSHVATYYNPLLYIPFYYAVTTLPPKAEPFGPRTVLLRLIITNRRGGRSRNRTTGLARSSSSRSRGRSNWTGAGAIAAVLARAWVRLSSEQRLDLA